MSTVTDSIIESSPVFKQTFYFLTPDIDVWFANTEHASVLKEKLSEACSLVEQGKVDINKGCIIELPIVGPNNNKYYLEMTKKNGKYAIDVRATITV